MLYSKKDCESLLKARLQVSLTNPNNDYYSENMDLKHYYGPKLL